MCSKKEFKFQIVDWLEVCYHQRRVVFGNLAVEQSLAREGLWSLTFVERGSSLRRVIDSIK